MSYPRIFLFAILFSQVVNTAAQQRPKIGVTLSGGGAKGLAHIGILQAIDSAGLQVDYVTGTSMGSIMGGLYAVGYSGDSIAEISRTLDWGVVLSNKPTLQNIAVEEKPEFGVYAVELPVKNMKPQFGPGILEGEELWLTLSKYFMPVHSIREFSDFKRGFKCIGADIETGNAVVMERGDIVNALRGSMAIPSVFTPVVYEGKTVIDGGIVRNFPVSDVRDMGADYVIGVSVNQGLKTADQLHSAIDVLYQISFYQDAKDFELQKQSCNNFVQIDLPGFSAASFGAADSILRIGQEEGRKWYPVFKALADSLNKIYGEAPERPMKYSLTDSVLISEISISGLNKTKTKSIEARMGLNKDTYYSADELNQAVRNAFGTRNYERIRYNFVPAADGKTNLQINASENSGVFLKAAIHFNSFTGGALVLNATAKNTLFPRSRMIVKANLGRDPKFKVAYHKFFGRGDEYGFGATANYDSYNMPIYDDYDQSAEYRYKEWWFDATLHKYFKTSSVYLGYSALAPKIIPKITDAVKLEGRNRYMNVKAGLYLNSLDKPNFATKGWHVTGEFAYYFNQRPDVELYYDDDLIVDLGTSDFDFDTYERLFVKAYSHTSVSPRSVITGGYHLGLQFDYKESFLNQFVVGGLTDFLRSQIPFAGLDHATINTESIGVLQAGWQYEISHNLYSTVKANAALYDFSDIEDASEITAAQNFLSGYAVTAGYASPIGPLELSLMYSDQSETFMGYLNLGFHF